MISDRPLDLDLAIIGMAGRFPGAGSIEAFWANLRAGVESIRDLTDDELRAAGVDKASLADRRFVRRAADLKDADLFDAGLFGFTPREAELMDPQFRVLLEDAWTALEDAGRLSDRRDLRIGVFAGCSGSTYLFSVLAASARTEGFDAMISLGNERDYLAAQIAYRLDLRGPTFVVQTACSTSLVAVHLACQSLLGRECDIALAGGVSIGVPQTTGYLWEEGSIVSPDGRCRAFDASAAGCVKGNGSGIVVLRRLEDALRDGDRIRAVIRGSAVNNDGAVKVGFTAPGEEGQAGVIAEALAAAGVDPATVGYVEAHGTATALGDPVEVSALARAFRPTATGRAPSTGTAAGIVPGEVAAPGLLAGPSAAAAPAAGTGIGRTAPCWLGSVKTNIGHLDAAAGVAGLIKTVLALEHREIPPSLHFERPNPRIDFDGTPFRVNAELRPWARSAAGEPRRAGVSSFGIGGTNAHVVLEEAPDRRRTLDTRLGVGPDSPLPRSHLIVLSAATEPALARATEALAARFDELAEPDREDSPVLADVAFTLQVGRRRLPWRRALVAEDAATAAAALRASGAARRDERRGSEVAFLFPGQGAQRVGMARGLYGALPPFRDAIDRCAGILQPILGLDLREVMFAAEGADASQREGRPAGEDVIKSRALEPHPREAAEERLGGTALAQPAVFALDWALAQLWMSWGIAPAAMVGHSLGELVAATLAGVFSLEDALAVVAERGRLMGVLPRGAMLAVPMSEEDLAKRLASHPGLTLAAVNGPLACVASGPAAAVARLESELDAEQTPYRRLRTSHAFHSSMMDPAVGAFEQHLRRGRLSQPTIPFVSNVTGAWISSKQATDPAYWAMHLRRPVRFADGIATLAAEPARILLEVGPGTALASMARAQAGRDMTIVSSLGRAKDDEATVLEALGRLWCAGATIDWSAVRRESPGRLVALPTYPFDRKRYWVDGREGAVSRNDRGVTRAADTGTGPGRSHRAARSEAETGAEAVDAVLAPEDGTGFPSGKNPDMAEWFYVPGWKRAVLPDPEPRARHDTPNRSPVPTSSHHERSGASATAASATGAEPAWLVLEDGSPLAAAVVGQVGAHARVATVRPGSVFARRGTTVTPTPEGRADAAYEIDPARGEDWAALVRDLAAAGPLPSRIVHLWCADGSRIGPDQAQDLGFFSFLSMLQAYAHAGGARDLRIVSIANALFDVAGEEVLGPERATLVGPCRVAPQEDPNVRCRLLDLGTIDPDEGARVIASEIGTIGSERVVAWRGGHRWVPSFERVRLGASSGLDPLRDALLVRHQPGAGSADINEGDRADRGAVGWSEAPHLAGSNLEDSASILVSQAPDRHRRRPRGVYVLTGGPGPLELALAARLARSDAKGIIFLGCESATLPALDLSAPSVEADSSAMRSEAPTPAPELIASTARVSDPAAVTDALAEARRRFGRIDAVFHTAGTIGGGMIALKERAAAERILAPRLRARVLLESLRNDETLVLFSGAISATGIFGQVDFCAASAYLDALAQSRRGCPGPRVVALDWHTTQWDRWEAAAGAGFEALTAQLREIQAQIGITIDEGIEAMGRALGAAEPQVIVSTEALEGLLAQAESASVADLLGAAAPGDRAARRREGRDAGEIRSEGREDGNHRGTIELGARPDGMPVVPPASDTERRVAALWSDLLGVSPVGRTDGFFELGGNSLLAIQLASRLRKEFDIELAIASLFESADLASLASAVDAALADRTDVDEVERLLAEIEALSEDSVRELSASAAGAVNAPAAIAPSATTNRRTGSAAPETRTADAPAAHSGDEAGAVEARRRPERPMRFSLYFFSDDGSRETGDKYRLLLESARFADAHGFEAVWTPERHFQAFGGLYPNPSVLGAALASLTSRIGIRAGSVALPLHNPIRVAEEWSVVDNLSNGRVAVSFASGWHPDDFVLFPTPYAERKERMFAGIETIRRLWAGETIAREGADGRRVEVRLLPRPVQRELPIWVTTAGSAETWRRAGAIGANVLAAMVGYGPEDLAELAALYRRARADAGHDPAAGIITLVAHAYVGMDDDAVRERVREPMTHYLKSYLGQFRNLGLAEAGGREQDALDVARLAFEHYFDTATLLGAPAKCARILDAFAAAGADEVACLIDFGLETDAVLEALPNLAKLRDHHEASAVIRTESMAAANARGQLAAAPAAAPRTTPTRTVGAHATAPEITAAGTADGMHGDERN